MKIKYFSKLFVCFWGSIILLTFTGCAQMATDIIGDAVGTAMKETVQHRRTVQQDHHFRDIEIWDTGKIVERYFINGKTVVLGKTKQNGQSGYLLSVFGEEGQYLSSLFNKNNAWVEESFLKMSEAEKKLIICEIFREAKKLDLESIKETASSEPSLPPQTGAKAPTFSPSSLGGMTMGLH